MSGFSFPPPPPPPPKSSSSNGNNQNGQSGPPGRGRGRGRGRGVQDNRGRGGRGSHSFTPRPQQQPGNSNHAFSTNSSYSNGPPARPSFNSTGQEAHGTTSNHNAAFNAPTGLPAGAYVNPAFHQQSSPFAIGESHRPLQSHFHVQHSSPQGGPSRTATGHKRKLEALRGPEVDVAKPGPPTAAPIPSFSSTVLSAKPVVSVIEETNAQKKRTTNFLGLTPGAKDPQYSASDSEEDDADEEALFAQLGESLKFEHNGEVMKIESAADLVEWKKERSRNFPTKDRIAAKMVEKRQLGEERNRLLVEASDALTALRLGNRSRASVVPPTKSGDKVQAQSTRPETALEKARRELAEQTEKLEKLREQVSTSEARAEALRAAKAVRDENAAMAASATEAAEMAVEVPAALTSPPSVEKAVGTPEIDEDEELDESDQSSVASEISSLVSPDSSDQDSDDSDGPPEEVSSKAPSTGIGTKQPTCRYFAASGYCRSGDACQFKHERLPGAPALTIDRRPPNKDKYAKGNQLDDLATAGRKSLHDRLVEQEQEDENRLAVQVIKYLGGLDFFAERNRVQR